jgi:NitT/TauT family transport system substrate-binding protein
VIVVLAVASGAAYFLFLTPKNLSLKQVTFETDYIMQGKYAPFYLALDNGYWTQQGLDVTIQAGSGSINTVQHVGTDRSQFGDADPSAVVIGESKAVPIVAVGSYFYTTPFGMTVWSSSGITSPATLAGKSIGSVAGGADQTLWNAMYSVGKVNPNSVNVVSVSAPSKDSGFVQQRYDAMMETDALDTATIPQADWNQVNFLPLSNYLNITGFLIITNQNMIQNHPDTIKAFLTGLYQGIAAASQDPNAALTALFAHNPQLNQTNERKNFLVSLPHMLAGHSIPDVKQNGMGWMDSSVLDSTVQTFLKYNYAGAIPFNSTQVYYTNQFNPGVSWPSSIPAPACSQYWPKPPCTSG